MESQQKQFSFRTDVNNDDDDNDEDGDDDVHHDDNASDDNDNEDGDNEKKDVLGHLIWFCYLATDLDGVQCADRRR